MDSTDKAIIKYDPLQRYLMEISRYKLLTRDEEIELVRAPGPAPDVARSGRHRDAGYRGTDLVPGGEVADGQSFPFARRYIGGMDDHACVLSARLCGTRARAVQLRQQF